MNERAIKLYEQATEFAYETIGKEHANTSYFQGTIAGKFAELIVKECRDIVSKTRDQAIEDEWNVDEAMSTAMFDIEEHFGVEE